MNAPVWFAVWRSHWCGCAVRVVCLHTYTCAFMPELCMTLCVEFTQVIDPIDSALHFLQELIIWYTCESAVCHKLPKPAAYSHWLQGRYNMHEHCSDSPHLLPWQSSDFNVTLLQWSQLFNEERELQILISGAETAINVGRPHGQHALPSSTCVCHVWRSGGEKDCNGRSPCRTWPVCRMTVPGSKDREVLLSSCNSVPVYLPQCIHQFLSQVLHTLLEVCADVSHTLHKAYLSVGARPWRLITNMHVYPELYHRANPLWLHKASVCL